ncbi:hypothetical protein DICVIV_05024 [Dictyocaulus viviparus]|uniref:Uncharacterized protein n=1 Tax=Dictyocaulus viviparus TaxID=29172 RepID=A0A0D8XYK4_DICVI|nr:hypothetical protein DICVIV_05024 [Dictyocaulus viviparus]
MLNARSSSTSSYTSHVKAEYIDIDMKRDFAEIAQCKPWTASKIFDGDLQLSKFISAAEQRTFENLNDMKNISLSSKLKTAQYALERNEIAKNPQRKSNYLRDLKYDKFDNCERELRRSHSSVISQPCEKDIVITCTVVIPHNKILTQEETRCTRLVVSRRDIESYISFQLGFTQKKTINNQHNLRFSGFWDMGSVRFPVTA